MATIEYTEVGFFTGKTIVSKERTGKSIRVEFTEPIPCTAIKNDRGLHVQTPLDLSRFTLRLGLRTTRRGYRNRFYVMYQVLLDENPLEKSLHLTTLNDCEVLPAEY